MHVHVCTHERIVHVGPMHLRTRMRFLVRIQKIEWLLAKRFKTHPRTLQQLPGNDVNLEGSSRVQK